jgi:hypothetical protein
MAGQFPIIAYFVVSSLPQPPAAFAPVLGLHAIGALGALAPVFWFG